MYILIHAKCIHILCRFVNVFCFEGRKDLLLLLPVEKTLEVHHNTVPTIPEALN